MYEFQYRRQRYWKAGFPTRMAARAAEAEHLKTLKTPSTLTAMGSDFRTVANDYLDYSRRKFSTKNYKGKVFVYQQFLVHAGNCLFAAIDARRVEEYLASRHPNSNYNRHRKALCALFAWGFHRGLISANPCVYVGNMPHQVARRRIPTQEEMVKILLAAGEYRPFFLCLYALAARLGEVNNLRWDDVNFEKREVMLWTRKGTGEYRAQVKAMNQEVYDELHRLYNKRSGEWVFPNPETGSPYRNRRAQIKRACLNAGVPYYSWHSIRHHVASLLADHFKESLPTIQRMLGHTQISTTSRYVQSLGDDVRGAADLLSLKKSPENKSENKMPGEAK